MNNCFIILAGGESKRFKSNIPKPYQLYKGKPLLLHSIDKAKNYKKFNKCKNSKKATQSENQRNQRSPRTQ